MEAFAGPTDIFDDSTETGSRFQLVIEFDQEESILGPDPMYAQLASSLALGVLKGSMSVTRVELIDHAHVVLDEDPTLTACEL